MGSRASGALQVLLDGGFSRPRAVTAIVRIAFTQVAAARGLRPDLDLDEGAAAVLGAAEASFADLEIEELGDLYESLIETTSRKHGGAHYTPRELAEEVVRYALDPMVRDKSGQLLAPAELLELRVADIAAGCGAFLLAAARYLADRLVESRGGAASGRELAEVVTRCLYGADIDPGAVEVCRHSLWLLAADPALRLSFLDDHVLCGNSLLGLVRPDEFGGRAVTGTAVADAVTAIELAYGARPRAELAAAYERLDSVLAAGDQAGLAEITEAGLTPTVPTDHDRWVPVHWCLAVPEIIDRGGFDAVIGNPPFLGVKGIRGALGQNVRDHLARTLLGGESGRSDLMVFFLAQALRLSRGTVGLVLSDAISEGDSARFGLQAAIDSGARIYRAETSRPWPGAAGVRIALLWLCQPQVCQSACVLDGHPVPSIGAGLGHDTSAADRSVPHRRPDWIPHGYQATIVLGKSLVLSPRQAAEMIAEDPRAGAWIREYLSGDDLVSTVGPRSSRRVLDLGDVELATLLDVPPIARHLRDQVRPEREAQFAKYPNLVERWWAFHNRVDRLYDAAAGLSEVIGLAKHAKYVWPVLVPVGPVFSNGMIVYPSEDRAVYGFLASEPHRIWAVSEGGSRLNQSHRYNPSRLLASYPFPADLGGVLGPGKELAQAVGEAGATFGIGVTGLLNLVHSVEPAPPEIERIRVAITEVDRAVLAAHGLAQIVLEHRLRTGSGRTWFGLEAQVRSQIKDALVEQAGRPRRTG